MTALRPPWDVMVPLPTGGLLFPSALDALILPCPHCHGTGRRTAWLWDAPDAPMVRAHLESPPPPNHRIPPSLRRWLIAASVTTVLGTIGLLMPAWHILTWPTIFAYHPLEASAAWLTVTGFGYLVQPMMGPAFDSSASPSYEIAANAWLHQWTCTTCHATWMPTISQIHAGLALPTHAKG